LSGVTPEAQLPVCAHFKYQCATTSVQYKQSW